MTYSQDDGSRSGKKKTVSKLREAHDRAQKKAAETPPSQGRLDPLLPEGELARRRKAFEKPRPSQPQPAETPNRSAHLVKELADKFENTPTSSSRPCVPSAKLTRYVELEYVYADEKSVTDACYVLTDATRQQEVSKGKLISGSVRVDLKPADSDTLVFHFHADDEGPNPLVVVDPDPVPAAPAKDAEAVRDEILGLSDEDRRNKIKIGDKVKRLGELVVRTRPWVISKTAPYLSEAVAGLEGFVAAVSKGKPEAKAWYSAVADAAVCLTGANPAMRDVLIYLNLVTPPRIEQLLQMFNWFNKGHGVRWLRQVKTEGLKDKWATALTAVIDDCLKELESAIQVVIDGLIDSFPSKTLPKRPPSNDKDKNTWIACRILNGTNKGIAKVRTKNQENVENALGELQKKLDTGLNDPHNHFRRTATLNSKNTRVQEKFRVHWTRAAACLRAEIESGACFSTKDNQAAPSEPIRVAFVQQGSTTGAHAKRLAPVLDGKSESQFLFIMKREMYEVHPCPNKSTKRLNAGNVDYEQDMISWEYDDGTLVRYKPKGDQYRPGPAYSIEVLIPGSQTGSITDAAFKVNARGEPVPKQPKEVRTKFGDSEQAQAAYEDLIMREGHKSVKRT